MKLLREKPSGMRRVLVIARLEAIRFLRESLRTEPFFCPGAKVFLPCPAVPTIIYKERIDLVFLMNETFRGIVSYC